MKIKHFLIGFSFAFTISAILYLAAVIAEANFNPFQWDEDTRGLISVIGTVLIIFAIAVGYSFSKDQK